MNALALVRALPDGATVPASTAKEAALLAERETARVASERLQTLWMWADIATAHLCEAPAWDPTDPIADHGRTPLAPEA